MNWTRIVGNAAGTAAACAAVHAVSGRSVSAGFTTGSLYGVGLCIASNLVGLFQPSPRGPQPVATANGR